MVSTRDHMVKILSSCHWCPALLTSQGSKPQMASTQAYCYSALNTAVSLVLRFRLESHIDYYRIGWVFSAMKPTARSLRLWIQF